MRHVLPKGEMTHRGQPVDLTAIRKCGLLTVEGEKDDISGVGQTYAANELCVNIPETKKQYYLALGVGHYGVFNGSRFRIEIASCNFRTSDRRYREETARAPPWKPRNRCRTPPHCPRVYLSRGSSSSFGSADDSIIALSLEGADNGCATKGRDRGNPWARERARSGIRLGGTGGRVRVGISARRDSPSVRARRRSISYSIRTRPSPIRSPSPSMARSGAGPRGSRPSSWSRPGRRPIW